MLIISVFYVHQDALHILRTLQNPVTLIVCRLQQFLDKKPISSSHVFSNFGTFMRSSCQSTSNVSIPFFAVPTRYIILVVLFLCRILFVIARSSVPKYGVYAVRLNIIDYIFCAGN